MAGYGNVKKRLVTSPFRDSGILHRLLGSGRAQGTAPARKQTLGHNEMAPCYCCTTSTSGNGVRGLYWAPSMIT